MSAITVGESSPERPDDLLFLRFASLKGEAVAVFKYRTPQSKYDTKLPDPDGGYLIRTFNTTTCNRSTCEFILEDRSHEYGEVTKQEVGRTLEQWPS